MPKITYVDHTGEARVVEATSGETVMEVAKKNGIPGIDADCGGACACATCHVYVDLAYMDRVGEASDTESSMLEFADGGRPNSRLSCQIKISQDLDGLIVMTPQNQW